MSLYMTEKEFSGKNIVCDDMILTVDMPTSAGSKMLEGYMSLFESEALLRAKNAGYTVAGKVKTGEFAIDLLGETCYFGTEKEDGNLVLPAAEAVKSGKVEGAIVLDVNGSVRRGTAQAGLVSIKPTYGTVSRYGTIPVACSGETVSVIASDTKILKELLDAVSGYDLKDGTSIPQKTVDEGKKSIIRKNKIAVIKEMTEGIDEEVKKVLEEAEKNFENNNVTVEFIDTKSIKLARNAWNVLMSAELCNNVSRYDGVKYGYRSQNYTSIDELYTSSRTEAFGELLKSTILFGSETLSTDNYIKMYDKALRIRRVISEEFASIFENYDAVIMPACSKMKYGEITDKYISFKENYYTAPASITGLPTVCVNGIQLMGKAFSDEMLISYAEICEKEGK